MQIPTCKYCSRPAAWVRPWDKTPLCLLHFNKSFEKRVRKTINQYKLFDRNDHIAVGISGGKDSVVLLHILMYIQKDFPTKITAITIDEGIEGYRQDGLRYAVMAAERAGIDHQIFSFEKRFNATLDDTLILLGNNGKRLGACSYCGIFRRKLLNEAALTVGASKLATGHNADDEAQTVLMNLLRGDLLKTLRSNPRPQQLDSHFVPRVKPFRWTSEQEIVLYAHFNDLPYQEMPCPNAVEAQRGDIRDMILNIKDKIPDVLFSILNSADGLLKLADMADRDLAADMGIVPKNPKPCKVCGQPSVTGLCRACIVEQQITAARNL